MLQLLEDQVLDIDLVGPDCDIVVTREALQVLGAVTAEYDTLQVPTDIVLQPNLLARRAAVHTPGQRVSRLVLAQVTACLVGIQRVLGALAEHHVQSVVDTVLPDGGRPTALVDLLWRRQVNVRIQVSLRTVVLRRLELGHSGLELEFALLFRIAVLLGGLVHLAGLLPPRGVQLYLRAGDVGVEQVRLDRDRHVLPLDPLTRRAGAAVGVELPHGRRARRVREDRGNFRTGVLSVAPRRLHRVLSLLRWQALLD